MNSNLNLSNETRLTDSMERDLARIAMEEMYQPHPIRAIARAIRRFADIVAEMRAKTTSFDREMI